MHIINFFTRDNGSYQWAENYFQGVNLVFEVDT